MSKLYGIQDISKLDPNKIIDYDLTTEVPLNLETK